MSRSINFKKAEVAMMRLTIADLLHFRITQALQNQFPAHLNTFLKESGQMRIQLTPELTKGINEQLKQLEDMMEFDKKTLSPSYQEEILEKMIKRWRIVFFKTEYLFQDNFKLLYSLLKKYDNETDFNKIFSEVLVNMMPLSRVKIFIFIAFMTSSNMVNGLQSKADTPLIADLLDWSLRQMDRKEVVDIVREHDTWFYMLTQIANDILTPEELRGESTPETQPNAQGMPVATTCSSFIPMAMVIASLIIGSTLALIVNFK